MRGWVVHWLDARGAVASYREAVVAALAEVEARTRGLIELPPLDLVVQAVPGRGVPGIGHVGFTPHPGAVVLTLDPAEPRLPDNFGAPLARTIAHELHHALRWDGPGYGRTLGEALVSEGLAGHFVRELFDSEPEPWERALDGTGMVPHARDAVRDWSGPYDHGAWFFGTGDRPNWTGYALGHALVGRRLDAHPDARPSALATAQASDFAPFLLPIADQA